MAAPGNAPISLTLDTEFGAGTLTTDALLTAMLNRRPDISEIIFSPGRSPQVEIHGQLIPVQGAPFAVSYCR